MTIKNIKKKIDKMYKEKNHIDIDERIVLSEELMKIEDKLTEVFDLLNNLPDNQTDDDGFLFVKKVTKR